MQKIYFTISIILYKVIASFETNDTECSLISPLHSTLSELNLSDYIIESFIIIRNFNDLNELNLNCSTIYEVAGLMFLPNDETYLDNTFANAEVFYKPNFSKYREITFVKIKGFRIVSFKKVNTYLNEYIIIVLLNSRFDFYINETKITQDKCKLTNFMYGTNFFGALKVIELDTTIYSKKTCPYVFKNNKLIGLKLGHITNSFIFKNQLEFIDINQTSDFDLNNRDLFYLTIGAAYQDITLRLIDKYVFKHIKRLLVSGVIESIQTDLFAHFKSLKFFCLFLDNLDRFLHNSDNSWMKYLNNEVNVDLNNMNEVDKYMRSSFKIEITSKSKNTNGSKYSFQNSYLYPDADFCLFKHFPHEHLVYPVFFSGDRIQCTCTIMWLIQYYGMYGRRSDLSTYLVQFYVMNDYFNHTILVCVDGQLNSRIKSCNFAKRLKDCNRSDFVIRKTNPITDEEIFFKIKWIEMIVFIFLQPIICFVGIITNLLSILTLKQHLNSKKEKDKKMYKHIFINSIFNLIYCILTLLKLINVCIFQISSFCSSLYVYESSQYFRIIIIYFFGNVIKLCCNVSYISFALSRFSLSINNENKFLNKFDKFSLKQFYFVTIVICTLLSIFKLFEYQKNEVYNSFKSFPIEKYDIGNCKPDNMKCYLFRYLELINGFIRDILFFIINLAIDLCLLHNSNENLKNKIKVTHDKLNLNAAVKSKKKITRMVLVNGFLFLISYTPEFITRIILLIFEKYLNGFCYVYLSCKEITDIAEFFIFLSISFQFFIYKKFNKNFSDKFNILKIRFLKFFIN